MNFYKRATLGRSVGMYVLFIWRSIVYVWGGLYAFGFFFLISNVNLEEKKARNQKNQAPMSNISKRKVKWFREICKNAKHDIMVLLYHCLPNTKCVCCFVFLVVVIVFASWVEANKKKYHCIFLLVVFLFDFKTANLVTCSLGFELLSPRISTFR